MPLIAREVIEVLEVGRNSTIDTQCWSMFGFIYGTFPTAPAVVIFAAKYGLDEETVSKSFFYHMYKLCT